MSLFCRASVCLVLFADYVVATLFKDAAGTFKPFDQSLLKVGTSKPLKQRLPFYHDSDELRSALQDAAMGCKTASATIEHRGGTGNDVVLDVVFIRGTGAGNAGAQKKPTALLVFGEHARELVSSESALHFLRNLCGLGSVSEGNARKTLSSIDFVLVPNSNPAGRKLVESGSFCKRTNENGVDLNRNWGNEHRDANAASIGAVDDDDSNGAQEENPGPSGFSEPETQILRDLARDVSPQLFLSIHSGAYLLGMPFGFSSSERPEHADEMVNMLSSISNRYCQGSCPYGSLAQTIGYSSKGCSIDYVVEQLKVPFAFTWEIYTDATHEAKFHAEAADDKAAGRKGSNGRDFWGHFSGHEFAREMQRTAPASSSSSDQDESCMGRFNPLNEAALNEVLDTWTSAYLDVANQVAAISTLGGHGAAQDASEAKRAIKAQDFSDSRKPRDAAQVAASFRAQDAAPSEASESFHPASADEYLENIREHRVQYQRKQEAEDSSADDEGEKANATVPSWDAFKADGNWGFLTARKVPDVSSED